MSSDYRPRGGSSSTGSSGSGGPRRRRGGRGRSGGGGSSSEHRPHTNGTSSHSSSPKKKVGPFTAFINWITGKKSSSPSPSKSSRPNIVTTSGRPDAPRPDNRERTPRAERTERAERPERPQREERPQADPTPQEIVSPKLYVGNLAYEAGESDLFDLFSKVGAVKNVEIAMDRHSNRSKGFGFVEMEALETAKEAAEKLNRTDFMGRQIVVSGAKVDKRPSNPREEEATDSTPSSSEESNI
jgi:RNA recognition motif-containing protein